MLNINKVFSSLLLFVVFSLAAIAQPKSNDFSQNKYNIPPGAVVSYKLKIIDYSYKLNSLVKSSSETKYSTKFTSYFTNLDLEQVKANDKALYSYYENAENYYAKLSNSVKATFTLEELWHIYFFDAKLKEQLLKIN